MAAPLVSVIIPAYRAGPFIGDTLASVRAQTHPNWELLVCEDGIFDDTAKQVRDFAATTANRVRFFQNPSNRGVSAARNTLLDAASGAFVAFLDADDVWTPHHLACSLEQLEAEKTDWIIGGACTIDSQGAFIQRDILPAPLPVRDIPTRLLSYNFILTGGLVIRSSVFAAGLRFDENLVVGEDLDLWIRILAAGHRPSFSRQATFHYRKHGTSTTANPARFAEGMAQLYAKHVNNPLVDRRTCARYLAQNLINTARLTRRQEPRRCLRAARSLRQHRPWHPAGWFYGAAGLASLAIGDRPRH